MSNSYPSGPPSSSNIYQRSSSINDETETGSFNDPPPTHGTRNNEPQTVSQRNLNGEAFHGQGPSISDMRHGGGNSATGNNSGFHQSDAPNFDDHIRPNYSQPDQDSPYSVGQTPGISGQARPNHSESAQPSTDDPLNPQDYLGISLVGKKFKEVNPTAYYVEK